MTHLLPKGLSVFREDWQRDCKSQRWLITLRKQCFSRYNRSCANVNSHFWQDAQDLHRLQPDKIPAGSRWQNNFATTWGAISMWLLLGKQGFFFVVWYPVVCPYTRACFTPKTSCVTQTGLNGGRGEDKISKFWRRNGERAERVTMGRVEGEI